MQIYFRTIKYASPFCSDVISAIRKVDHYEQAASKALNVSQRFCRGGRKIISWYVNNPARRKH